MYFVYADGNSIYNPFDSTLTIHSPKVTLELGKAGSFQFDIPPTNQFYNQLTELKTVIRVELDNKTIFYGRVFSITRNFNNIKKVYCEGALSYLVDTLQQAESYKGKAAPLFRKIIEAHNKLADSDKKFTVDKVQIQDQDVIIPGKKDKDGKYYGDKYEQTIIESIAEEWLTTYDYINNVLIEYLGGYLMCDYDFPNDKLKISYISEDQFDSMISEAESRNLTVPSIDYGVNMLDLTEELNAEDLCTVLIPLGDDGLTIEKATNKDSHSDVKVVKIDDKYIGIAHKASVEKYGTIIKSYVFDNVNEANTLFTNGYKYLKAHKNIPLSFTVKAVDMHFVNPDQDTITLGEIAKIDSTPHGLTQYLICTKIEYDFEDASKNLYTFGNPRQSMTERYKKNKEKARSRASRSSAKSSGKALSTASEITQEYVDNAVKEINDNYATTKTWVEKHYAGIEDSVRFVTANTEGIVRATRWVGEYSANAEEVLTWHSLYSDSAVSTIKWASDYSAGIEETVSWKNANAEGLVNNKMWVDNYSAGILDSVSWKSQNADGLVSTKKWVDDNIAAITSTVEWKTKNATGLAETKSWVDSKKAAIESTVSWKTNNEKAVSSIATISQKVSEQGSGIELLTQWKGKKEADINSISSIRSKANANEASIKLLNQWKSDTSTSLSTVISKANANEASISMLNTWKGTASTSISAITSKANKNEASINLLNRWKSDASTSISSITSKANKNEANITLLNNWKGTASESISSISSKANANEANITLLNNWKGTASDSISSISSKANANEANITLLNNWKSGADSSISSISTIESAANANAASIKALNEWKSGAVKSISTIESTANANAASIKTLNEWKSGAVKSISSIESKADANAASITAINEWQDNTTKSVSGIDSVANKAYAMAGLFAIYNNNEASIKLSADASGSIVDVIANEINATNSKILAYVLSADNVDTKIFKANGFGIGSERISVTKPIWQTINDSDVTVIRNLYTGSSADADNRVLSRYGTQNLIDNSISSLSFVDEKLNLDTTAVRKAIKGEHSSVVNWLINDLLYTKKLKISEGTQIFDSDGTGVTLKQYITNLIDADYIKKALTGADIAKKLANQTINCNVLTVMKDKKSRNILDLVKEARQDHYHTISQGSVVVAVAKDGKIKNTADVDTGYGKAY